LFVPITSSTSCDQPIFVDQAIDVSLSSDAVLVEVDRLGEWLQWRCAVQGAVRQVLIVVGLVLAQDLSQMGLGGWPVPPVSAKSEVDVPGNARGAAWPGVTVAHVLPNGLRLR
jgi:hypothetical protein